MQPTRRQMIRSLAGGVAAAVIRLRIVMPDPIRQPCLPESHLPGVAAESAHP